MDKINLTALNALGQKVDSGLDPDNAHLISEEYNVLLTAVKNIGAAVNQLIEGGQTTKVTISASASPSGAGTVSGAGSYDQGASVTLTATAAAGYTFVKWTDASGATVSTSASYTFSASAAASYVAVFEAATVGDVTITMSAGGVISNMASDDTNADTILYSINGASAQTYTSGNVTLNSNDTIKAVAKNSTTGAVSPDPVVTVTYDADANTLTAASTYDMTVAGVNKGKTYTFSAVAGTTTITANCRTTTIIITNE